MLSRTLTVAALACALTGCVSVSASGPTPAGTATAPVTSTSKIRALTASICRYQPAAATVIAIAKTFTGYTGNADQLASDIARGICSAVTEAYASNAAPEFRGVVIKGAPR